MTLTESIAMNWRGHIQNVVREMQRIDALPLVESHKKHLKLRLFKAACHEWRCKGWRTAEKFLRDNLHSQLDFSGELKRPAPSFRVSAAVERRKAI